MLSLYTSIILISSFSLAVVTVGIFSNHYLSLGKRRCFHALFLMLIGLNWLEWLGTVLNGYDIEYRYLHIFAKFAELSLTPVVPITAVKIISPPKKYGMLYIPAVFNLFLQLYSLKTGCVFSVDSLNFYARGPLYLLYMLTFVSTAIILIYYCTKFSREYQYSEIAFLLMLAMLIIISVVLPIAAPDLKLDWTCMSFASIIFYIYFIQLKYQTDSVTSLLNRRTFDYAVENISRPTTVIFFDVDSFKKVNDTLGHGYGDHCLKTLGFELKRFIGKRGFCYRFGGDEFCVIMKKDVADIGELIIGYLERAEKFKIADENFPGISVGYAHFNPKEESISDALKRADDMMYKNKNKKYGADSF